jgi:hypothetical protein
MNIFQNNINIKRLNLIKLFLTSIFFFIFFFIIILIRGEGWDGDSVVNIAQFYKLIFSDLYGILDGGTHPKLLTIMLFGGFHYLFESYSIHWVVILISSFAFAKVVLLNKNYGGGFLWFWLPFISPTLILSIISADNPSMAISFYILAIVYTFEKKIIWSFICLFLAELSRPGYSVLMTLSLLFFIFNNTLSIKKNIKQIILILILITFAFIHTLFSFKLAYPSLEILLNLFDTDKSIFLENKFFTLITFFNGIIVGLFSHNILPFPISLLCIIFLFLCFRHLKHISTILFLLPSIYFPTFFAAITKGAMGAKYYDTFFLNKLYASGPHYYLTLVPIFLFSISILFNKIIKTIIISKFFRNFINIFSSIRFQIILALCLVIGNGIFLQKIYEVNPPQTNLNPSKHSHKMLSDKDAIKNFKNLYELKKDKLNILTTADTIPIIIDNAKYIKKLTQASFEHKDGIDHAEILLSLNNKYEVPSTYDVLYTKVEFLNYFKLPKKSKIIYLKLNRIFIIL